MIQRHSLKVIRDAIPDPNKLELLANWIDSMYPFDPNPEVQRDLRIWAKKGRKVLTAISEGAIP